MRPARPLLAAALCLAVCAAGAGPARAGNGEEGFRFLNDPLSPRAAGMSGAAVALADDAGTAAWNPAAWGEMRRGEAFLSNARLTDGAGVSGISLAWPLSSGTLGVDARTMGYGDIQGYDAGGLKTETVNARDTAFAAAYGRTWGRSWTWGAVLRQSQEKLAGFSGQALSVDGGALWHPISLGALRGLRLGASVRNVGGSASIGSEKTALPRTLSLGAAYRAMADGWTTSVSMEKAGAQTASWSAGQEVWLGRLLALRAGYAVRRGFSGGLSLGAGFRVGDVQVDYAFSSQGKGYQDAQRVGLTWRFGGPVEAMYQEGVRLLRAGRYGEAILKFNEVLELRPGHRGAIDRLREAADLLRRQEGGGSDGPK